RPGAASLVVRVLRLLEVVEHPVDRGLDLLVGQRGVAALGGHHAGAAGEALDGVLVQRVLALGDARGPRALGQGRGTADAAAVAGTAQVLEDHRTVGGAAVGDLRGGGGRGSRGGGGLGGGAGVAGVDRADRRDALLGAGGGRGRNLRRDAAVQVGRQQDQAEGDQGQHAQHHRETLQEFQVVVAHFASYWRAARGRSWPIIGTDAPASEARRPAGGR